MDNTVKTDIETRSSQPFSGNLVLRQLIRLFRYNLLYGMDDKEPTNPVDVIHAAP